MHEDHDYSPCWVDDVEWVMDPDEIWDTLDLACLAAEAQATDTLNAADQDVIANAVGSVALRVIHAGRGDVAALALLSLLETEDYNLGITRTDDDSFQLTLLFADARPLVVSFGRKPI